MDNKVQYGGFLYLFCHVHYLSVLEVDLETGLIREKVQKRDKELDDLRPVMMNLV